MTTSYLSDSYLINHAQNNIPQLEDKEIKEVFYKYPRRILADSGHFNKDYYSKTSLDYASYKITELLTGVHPEGKNIIVPFETILSVMESMYENKPRVYWKILLQMSIVYIVEQIKQEYDAEAFNKSLDIEVIKYAGDFGLRKVPAIKLREKRPTPFIFNMHY